VNATRPGEEEQRIDPSGSVNGTELRIRFATGDEGRYFLALFLGLVDRQHLREA